MIDGLVLLAGHGSFAGAGEFEDAEAVHQRDELLDLALVAGDLDGQRFGLHVHDLRAEDVGDLHDLGTVAGVGAGITNGNPNAAPAVEKFFATP